jgi:hypothetical protein
MATFTSGSRRGWGCDSSALLDCYFDAPIVRLSAGSGAEINRRRKSVALPYGARVNWEFL